MEPQIGTETSARRTPFWKRRAARIGVSACGGLFLLVGGVWYWYTHRPLPKETRRTLFEGVTYLRDVRRHPRPHVVHVVIVDKDAPGIGFHVTPGKPGQKRPLRARTTSQYLGEFRTQVAINGDFFYPWHSRNLLDYYPHVGDPVTVEGFSASQRVAYTPHSRKRPTLYLSQDNRLSINTPVGTVYNAISGNWLLLDAGKPIALTGKARNEPMPRTAIALDRAAKRLIILLVDGRQPNYSEGVTVPELCDLLREYGGHTAINLDGGGSTTLVIEEADGRPRVLNSPIDNHIPGRERPVANHLGLFARRLPKNN